jgi:hypothetical protein
LLAKLPDSLHSLWKPWSLVLMRSNLRVTFETHTAQVF